MTGIFSKNGVLLDRLQTLEKVVRAGSIALAAKGDPNAQSQISRQIGELEAAPGMELLDRTKKPFQPTRAALHLAQDASLPTASGGGRHRWVGLARSSIPELHSSRRNPSSTRQCLLFGTDPVDER